MNNTDLLSASVARLPVCGVYFLFKENELIYIGKSTNIYTRLGGHKDKKFDRVTAVECDEANLGAIEYALIAAYQPKLNGGLIPVGKSRD
jgi:excinuclease UvrABC nuclease subunit